jgi:integrase
MRRGELLALRWGDIDFEKGVLHVQRRVNFVSGLGYQEGEPKTRAGRRDIMLPDVTVEALKEHRVLQEQARLKMGKKWREQGLVCCNICGGFFNPSRVTMLFQRLLKKAGLPYMRLHDLRHSAATILRASGSGPQDNSRAFGTQYHSDDGRYLLKCSAK